MFRVYVKLLGRKQISPGAPGPGHYSFHPAQHFQPPVLPRSALDRNLEKKKRKVSSNWIEMEGSVQKSWIEYLLILMCVNIFYFKVAHYTVIPKPE